MKNVLRSFRAGFTLLEVMVSTAIMVVIVLTVVSIASDTLRVYDRAVADLSTQSEARGVLDAMDNDFSTAVLRADGRCWMEIVVPGSADVTGAPGPVGNLQPTDHPIVMLFAAPPDRPRWTPGANRRALRGDVSAVAYRIGQRSPFDAPGEKIQQVYGVYRTLIDSESTFAEAMPLILSSTIDQPRYPWDYWSGSRRFANYSRLPNPDYETRTLIDANISSTSPCWTMDENNFIASNVVAMNLVFWCSSMLPATAGDTAQATNTSFLKDPLGRQPQSLRPVVLVGSGDDKSAMTASQGGYLAMYRAGQGVPPCADAAAACFRRGPPLRAELGAGRADADARSLAEHPSVRLLQLPSPRVRRPHLSRQPPAPDVDDHGHSLSPLLAKGRRGLGHDPHAGRLEGTAFPADGERQPEDPGCRLQAHRLPARS